MTHVIITSDDPRETYEPSSPQATFTIPFAFFDLTDIKVIVDGVDAVYNASPSTNLQFSIAGNVADGGFQGGSFTLGATVNGVTVIVYREVPATRTTDFPYPSPTLNIKELNTQIDRIFATIQQIGRDIGRTVKLAISSTLDSINLPVPEAAKLLRWNSTEDGLENVDVVGMGSLSLPLSLAQGGTGANHATVASLFAAIKQAATELATGVAKIATQAITDALTNDTDSVTPLKLGAWSGRYVGLQNLIENADFVRNARANAGTLDNGYAVDRWRGLTEHTGLLIGTDNSVVPTDAEAHLFVFSIAGDLKFGALHVLPSNVVKRLRGQQVTFKASMLVTNTRLGNMKIGIMEWTGTADAVTGDPISAWGADGVTPTLAASWAFLNTPANQGVGTSFADTTPITVTVGASANNLGVFIWCDDKTFTANDTFRIAKPMWNIGPIALPFERRSPATQVQDSQRYLHRAGGDNATGVIGSGYVRSATVARIYVPFPVTMRTPPTGITVANAANFRVIRAATTVAVTGITFVQADANGAFIDATVAAGLTGGEGVLLDTTNANATILFTGAEI